MAFAKKKILTSALGSAVGFVYLHKPDYGQGDFKNERGVYKVMLTIPNKDPRCQTMIDEIVAAHEADYAARLEEYEANPPKPKPGKKPLKPFVGDMPFIDNEDGTTTFTFKCYGSFQDRKTGEVKPITVRVVDSRGQALTDVPAISAGSELKIKYTLMPYGWSAVAGASVKLQLEGAMLVKLVEFGGGAQDDWGDEVVEDEDGFQASQHTPRQTRQETGGNGSWDEQDAEDQESDSNDGDF